MQSKHARIPLARCMLLLAMLCGGCGGAGGTPAPAFMVGRYVGALSFGIDNPRPLSFTIQPDGSVNASGYLGIIKVDLEGHITADQRLSINQKSGGYVCVLDGTFQQTGATVAASGTWVDCPDCSGCEAPCVTGTWSARKQ